MKTRYCILFVFFFLGVAKANAQFRVGAEVGLNVSSLAIIANGHNANVVGGASFDYLFKNGMVLQTGLSYSSKGASGLWDRYNYAADLRQLDVHLGYLEIPLMVGYRIPLLEKVHLVPAIGAYFAYGVVGYGEVDVIVSNENGHARLDYRWDNPYTRLEEKGLADTYINAFERFDSGLRFGLSGEIADFVVSFAYDLGLKKVWSGFDTPSYNAPTHKMKNRVASVSIGYKFAL